MPFGFGRGGGRGRGWGRRFRGCRGSGGSPENCICPKCSFIVPHVRGKPCFQTRCPRCNSPMARQFLQY